MLPLQRSWTTTAQRSRSIAPLILRDQDAAARFLCHVYKRMRKPGSHSYATMRISLRLGILTRQGNRAMTKDLKKGQRIGRTPKTGTELAISPRRVIVFKPSAILKQRINGHSPRGVA
jgi:integration host factor subunit alpha